VIREIDMNPNPWIPKIDSKFDFWSTAQLLLMAYGIYCLAGKVKSFITGVVPSGRGQTIMKSPPTHG